MFLLIQGIGKSCVITRDPLVVEHMWIHLHVKKTTTKNMGTLHKFAVIGLKLGEYSHISKLILRFFSLKYV